MKQTRWPLIDDHLKFADAARPVLSDSPGKDFLVVGVLGPHGVGKSTLLSALHGGTRDPLAKIFPSETLEHLTGMVLDCNCTLGFRVASDIVLNGTYVSSEQ